MTGCGPTHNHWLRQEAIVGRIRVVYTPTNDIIVDGLTKSLTSQKHLSFVIQIGLVDIKDELDRRRLDELESDFFDKLEDSFEGGEFDVVTR